MYIRIEEIKIGDLVLSSPQDGTGGAEYKKVTNTFRYEEKTLLAIRYHREGNDQARIFFTTGDQLYWVNGAGWTAGDKLNKRSVLRMADGTLAEMASKYPVYRTSEKNIGWFQRFDDVENSHGTLMDCVNYRPIPSDGNEVFLSVEVYESDDPYLRVDVYSIEVEDFHTYFVTGDGILVHDGK